MVRKYTRYLEKRENSIVQILDRKLGQKEWEPFRVSRQGEKAREDNTRGDDSRGFYIKNNWSIVCSLLEFIANMSMYQSLVFDYGLMNLCLV